MRTQKALPQYLSFSQRPDHKTNKRKGIDSQLPDRNGKVNQFENWELEKKYKKTQDALKAEIEERNKKAKQF